MKLQFRPVLRIWLQHYTMERLTTFLVMGFVTCMLFPANVLKAQDTPNDSHIYLPVLSNGSTQLNFEDILEVDAEPDDYQILLGTDLVIPHRKIAYVSNSGVYNTKVQSAGLSVQEADNHTLVYSQTIYIEDAAWLQIHFGESFLGKSSYLKLISHSDVGEQVLDGKSFTQWSNSSAMFNGNSVTVELYAATNDEGVFYSTSEVTVGEYENIRSLRAANFSMMPGIMSNSHSICGANDNRTRSFDPAVGRAMNASLTSGCTAWLIANGAYLTAGHCFDSNTRTILQFNVPESDSDGTRNHPPPQDQYPIDPASVQWQNDGPDERGDDWAIFSVNASSDPNGNLRLPPEAQGEFFRVTRDFDPTLGITVIGYGLDGPAPCYGSSFQPGCTVPSPPRNSDNSTQQSREGVPAGETIEGDSDSFWEYEVDTQGGNSGSPIIVDGVRERLTIGIHTNGDSNLVCTDGTGNAGTSFENDSLETAINDFFGENFVYVDSEHPVSFEDGTIMRPYNTIFEGRDNVPNTGTVSIVEGIYAAPLTIDTAMTLVAPVGLVSIGGE